MSDLLPFIISGIALGSVYALAGTGLVLTYKTSGVFNFGQGALATVGAYAFYWLYVRQGLPWGVAAALTCLVVGPLLGLFLERMTRGLVEQPTYLQIVGTIGIILLVVGLATLGFGEIHIDVPNFFPHGTETFEFGGVNIAYTYVIITGVCLVTIGALYILFYRSRLGVAMRAVVDDPQLISMKGTNPVTIRRIAWIIGASFATTSGVLLVPLVGLVPLTLTLLVVQAFAAGAFGAFSAIGPTVAGGVLLGIATAVSSKYVISVSWLAGLPLSLPFIVLVVVLLVLPRRKLLPRNSVRAHPPLDYHAPVPLRITAAVVVLAALAIVPFVAADRLTFFTTGLAAAVLYMSLGLLVRTSGQVSLCQPTFAAIGAVAFSIAATHGVPWILAVGIAGLVVIPVGALVAIPAIRLSGLFLALATLGFGLLVERMFYPMSWMFTTLQTGREMPRPPWAGGDEAFYFVVLAFVVATALIMEAIHSGRLGRMLRAMSRTSLAPEVSGLSTRMTKVIVFCIAAFFAAVSGVLYGSALHVASTTDSYFTAFNGLILVAVLALAPFGPPWYALFAGLTVVIPSFFSGPHTNAWLNVIFGVFAMLVAVQGGPAQMPQALRRFLDRLGGRGPALALAGAGTTTAALDQGPVVPAHHASPVPEPTGPVEAGPGSVKETTGLEVTNLTVRFGGLVAVNALSFDVPMGRITGLIGPNGAGKTTTFNACSGLVRPTEGEIFLHGKAITRTGPPGRARAGLGRTFQRTDLGEALSVHENVALGHEARLAGAGLRSQFFATKAEKHETADAVNDAIELCGIADLRDTPVGLLSTGQRRLVELARCLAGSYDVLLLDEPSSGLDQLETAALADALVEVVRHRGCGVLLVEHNVELVMKFCSHIYVMDFGKLMFEGDATAVAESPTVREVYLGEPIAASKEEAL